MDCSIFQHGSGVPIHTRTYLDRHPVSSLSSFIKIKIHFLHPQQIYLAICHLPLAVLLMEKTITEPSPYLHFFTGGGWICYICNLYLPMLMECMTMYVGHYLPTCQGPGQEILKCFRLCTHSSICHILFSQCNSKISLSCPILKYMLWDIFSDRSYTIFEYFLPKLKVSRH